MVPVEDGLVAKVRRAVLVVVPVLDVVNKVVVLRRADRGVPVSEAVEDRGAADKGALAARVVPDAAPAGRVVDTVVPAEVNVDRAVWGEGRVVRHRLRIRSVC